MNNIKYKKCSKLLVLVIILAVLCTGFVSPTISTNSGDTNVAYTSSGEIADLDSEINRKNMLFTENDHLTNSDGQLSTDKIQDYPDYIKSRYPHAHKLSANLEDEQIFKIIPEEIFIKLTLEPGDYSYIGLEYGYYVSHLKAEDTYMVYIFDTQISKNNINGSENATDFAKMKISLLYYEEYEYIYNAETKSGIASIMMTYQVMRYVNSVVGLDNKPIFVPVFDYFAYEQYSTSNDIYMKDVAFAGNIFNKYHANVGQPNYMPYKDDGLYMMGTTTKYSGVTNSKNGFWQPIWDLTGTALGLIPYGGGILTIKDSIGQVGQFMGNLIQEGDEVSNENNNPTVIKEERTKNDQIKAYGSTLKNGRVGIYSDDSAPLLFGMPYMKSGELKTSYVENEFILTSHEDWEAEFIGNVSLKLVSKQNNGDLTLIKEINSNNYSIDLNSGTESDTFELYDNVAQEVYLAPNVAKEYAFTAPHSGKYEFKTYCDYNHTHGASCDAKIQLDPNIGKDVINGGKVSSVVLIKGETIKVTTNLVKGDQLAYYSISANYIPYSTSVDGGVCSIDLTGNVDYSYIEFEVLDSAAYNFEIAAKGTIKVELFSSNMIDTGSPIFTSILENSMIRANELDYVLAEYLTEGTYVAKVTAYNPTTVNFAVSSCDELNFGKDYVNGFNSQVFHKMSIYSDTNLVIESNNSASIDIYNESGRKLDYDITNGICDIYIASGVYYIKVEGQVNYKFTKEIESMNFGENQVSTFFEAGQKMMTLTSPTDFTISINHSSNVLVEVYDKNNNLISDLNNIKLLAFDTYFIKIKLNSGINCVVNVVVDAVVPDDSETEQISNVIGEDGYTVINYTPHFAGYFNHFISPNLDYEIYNKQINKLSDSVQFAYGQNYFIKIYGNVSEQFHMSFVNTDNTVVINDLNVVKNNQAYSFVVNQSSSFLFKAFKANFSIDIISLHGDIISRNLDIFGDGVSVEIQAGTYFIIPNTPNSSGWLSINDKNITPDDNQLKLDTNGSDIGLAAGASKRLYYAADVDATYYFEFSRNVPEDILSVYYYAGSEVKYMDLVRDQNNAEIFIFELIQDTTYYFTIENYTDVKYDFDISLYRPGKISSILIDNNVIEKNDVVELVIGETYSLTADFFYYCTNTPLYIEIGFDLFTIDSKNNITAVFNQDNVDRNTSIHVYTELNHFTINIELIAPYTVKSELSGNDLELSVKNVKNVGVMLPIGSTITTGAELQAGSIVDHSVADDFAFEMSFIGDSYQYSFKNDVKFIDANTTITIQVKIACGQGDYLNYNFDNNLVTKHILGSETSSADSRVYLRLDRSDKTLALTLQSNVETVIFADESFQREFTSFSLTMHADGQNDINIYIKNLNWHIKSSSDFAISSSRANTAFTIDGNVKFSGLAKTGLMNVKDSSFSGKGKFEVICDNTATQEDNGNGSNGISGLIAENIVIYKDSAISVKIQAGNGMSGKTGVDGKGTGLKYKGYDGRIGGRGGNGGIALQVTSFTNYSNTVAKAINGSGGAGSDGGDGANGAASCNKDLPGGAGGNGGGGGTGGAAGAYISIANVTIIKGNLASAGSGGNGGKGGDGNTDQPGETRSAPSAGGNGGNGGAGGATGSQGVGYPGNGGAGGQGGGAGGYYEGANGGNGGKGYIGGIGGDAGASATFARFDAKGGNGGKSFGYKDYSGGPPYYDTNVAGGRGGYRGSKADKIKACAGARGEFYFTHTGYTVY